MEAERDEQTPDDDRVVGEDVLAGDAPEPPARPAAPRNPFRRRTDFVVAALILAVVVAVGALIWRDSDVEATTHEPAAQTAKMPEPPASFPPTLGEVWRAPSSATPVPVTAGPAVVTGDGGEVVGRDPESGDVRWRYAREIPLCTIGGFGKSSNTAVTVYRRNGNALPADDPRKEPGCSEVTELRGDNGKIEHQRNSDAERGTRLLSDGSYLTATGTKLIDVYRSDMVISAQIGVIPALKNHDRQPQDGREASCAYGSIAVGSSKVGVIERCVAERDKRPADPGDRLTVFRAGGKEGKESDEPQAVYSVVLGGTGARIVGVTDTHTAVALPNPPRLVVYSDEGKQATEHPLTIPPADLAGDPPGKVVATEQAPPDTLYWFTGSRTVALSTTDLRPLWSIEGTRGPGTVFAGRLLLPTADGISVHDPANGTPIGVIRVDRGGYSGPVTMSSLGPMVLEQRGATLVALR
ncbi:putative pyrroloquinoline-quinone binding quinoprotein [Herbihabitans rhizosphaerae]|uniref:Putative pyrroloquinoline-quinone binding quinoprotein n=1 Tax=Herbihabitans rhizosphaerae TaxID=1872711 RepID=A0A4Q7L4L8_9PSEU|nr:PQQ-binding-like beta-propeller repeat protein [Herbihabitans rhizosphaerae]RZS44235.1 putative pyrroloquinoline-quinone binding quinoprotein [Herbihabitans rhizosphaerae]